MSGQRITDLRQRVVGYIEEASSRNRLELLDAGRQRLGWFSPESDLTISEDGRVIGQGNKLLRLLPVDCARVRIEPIGE